MAPRRCWVVTSGEAGHVAQALGLAEALGFADAALKTIGLRWPWRWLPNWPWLATQTALDPARDRLRAPWPDVLISCGRNGAFAALAVRKASRGRCRLIQILDPGAGRDAYDVLISPEHDRLRGANVLTVQVALHRVTVAKLAAGAAALAPEVAHLPRPLVAVLVGGSNRYYTLDRAWAAEFWRQLATMARETPCGLLVTPSRRTGAAAEAALREALAGAPAAIWDGTGSNPYFGYLGLADAIIVTCDSVSMIAEACATGKPVLLARLPGRSARFERLYARLEGGGHVRWFTGNLVSWTACRLDDMDAIAAEVRQRLEWAA